MIKYLSEEIPKCIIILIKNGSLWKRIYSIDGKHMFLNKVLKWIWYGPQGPYKPFTYFVKEVLPSQRQLEEIYGITAEEYWLYCQKQWKVIGLKERQIIKYKCKLKNVLECIERGQGRNSLWKLVDVR